MIQIHESIPIQFTIFTEFWIESILRICTLNWIWIELQMLRIESELNLLPSPLVESESELNLNAVLNGNSLKPSYGNGGITLVLHISGSSHCFNLPFIDNQAFSLRRYEHVLMYYLSLSMYLLIAIFEWLCVDQDLDPSVIYPWGVD